MLVATASPSHRLCQMLTPRYALLRSRNTSSQQTWLAHSTKFLSHVTPWNTAELPHRSEAYENMRGLPWACQAPRQPSKNSWADLYCSGNSSSELLSNWKKVLQALHKCDLWFSASKTIINPQSTTILYWVWNSGTLSASSHRIAALASCL